MAKNKNGQEGHQLPLSQCAEPNLTRNNTKSENCIDVLYRSSGKTLDLLKKNR